MTSESFNLNIEPQRLNQHALKLSQVSNYYLGYQSPDDDLLPNNVLMFNNRTAFVYHVGSAHHRHVLIVPIQTAGQVIVDQAVFDLKPGQAILIQPWQLHRYANFQSQALSWLFITFEITNTEHLQNLRDIPVQLNDRLFDLLEQACIQYLKLEHSNTNAINLVRLYLGLMLQMILVEQQTTTPVKINPQPSSLISQVGQLVVTRMDQPMTVSFIAEELAISQSHLRSRFRQEYHIGVLQYIRQLKMLHAMRLLSTTELTISQIAQRCGFSSLFSFSRSFKSHANISPKAYRLQNR